MAISWGDVLSVGAGMAERDSEHLNADFKMAMEEFKDNKTLVRDLAKTRYARDLKTYDEEFAKAESLKSVYTNAANQNMNTAALMIAQAENPVLFKTLSDSDAATDGNALTSYINSYKDNFTKNYKKGDDGEFALDDKGEKILESFTFNRKDFTLNEPKQNEYFLGNKYWSEKRKDIDKTVSSPLADEIRNLLGKEKKEVDATSYINDMENKKITEIKTAIEGGQTYTSTNVSDSGTSTGLMSNTEWRKWEKKNEKWVSDHKALIKDVEWGSLTSKDNFINFLSQLDLQGATTEANFEFKDNDIVIKNLSGDAANNARAIIATYKSIYNSAIASIDPRLLAMQGVARVDLPKIINRAEINKTVRQLFNQRSWSEKYDGGAFWGGDEQDFIGYLSTNIVDLDGNITLPNGKTIKANDLKDKSNILKQYQKFLKDEAELLLKEKGNNAVKMKGNVTVNAMNIIQTQMRDSDNNQYVNKFLSNLNLDLKDSATVTESSSTDSSSETTSTTNKIKVVTENGVSGISDGTKFKSWEQLEKENLVEKTLEKYPYLKSDYDKYKEGSSITKTTESGVEYIPWG